MIAEVSRKKMSVLQVGLYRPPLKREINKYDGDLIWGSSLIEHRCR